MSPQADFPTSLGCLMLYELCIYEVVSLVERSAGVRSFRPEVVSYMQWIWQTHHNSFLSGSLVFSNSHPRPIRRRENSTITHSWAGVWQLHSSLTFILLMNGQDKPPFFFTTEESMFFVGGLMHLSPPGRCNPAFRRRCVSSCPQTCFPYTFRSLRSWYGPRSPTSHYPTSDLWGQNTQTRCMKFTSDNWCSQQTPCLASADSWQLIAWSLAVGARGQWARRTGRPPPCSAFIIKEHD